MLYSILHFKVSTLAGQWLCKAEVYPSPTLYILLWRVLMYLRTLSSWQWKNQWPGKMANHTIRRIFPTSIQNSGNNWETRHDWVMMDTVQLKTIILLLLLGHLQHKGEGVGQILIIFGSRWMTEWIVLNSSSSSSCPPSGMFEIEMQVPPTIASLSLRRRRSLTDIHILVQSRTYLHFVYS